MQVAAPLESALNKSPILFSVSNFIILSLVRTIKGIQDYVLYDRLRLFPLLTYCLVVPFTQL